MDCGSYLRGRSEVEGRREPANGTKGGRVWDIQQSILEGTTAGRGGNVWGGRNVAINRTGPRVKGMPTGPRGCRRGTAECMCTVARADVPVFSAGTPGLGRWDAGGGLSFLKPRALPKCSWLPAVLPGRYSVRWSSGSLRVRREGTTVSTAWVNESSTWGTYGEDGEELR